MPPRIRKTRFIHAIAGIASAAWIASRCYSMLHKQSVAHFTKSFFAAPYNRYTSPSSLFQWRPPWSPPETASELIKAWNQDTRAQRALQFRKGTHDPASFAFELALKGPLALELDQGTSFEIKCAFYVICAVRFCVYSLAYYMIYAFAVVCSWPIESIVLCLALFTILMCPDLYRLRSLQFRSRNLCPWILARRARNMISESDFSALPFHSRRVSESSCSERCSELATVTEFPYSTLPVEPQTIRILVIHPSPTEAAPIICSLIDYGLDQIHDSEALSYRWGNPTDSPTDAIICNGHPFLVRKNLFDALNHLRRADTPRRIWVDAICINQAQNANEKASQLSLMPDIYGGCSQVVIWLGEHFKGADTAVQLMKDIQEFVVGPGLWLDQKFIAESRTNPHDVLRSLSLPSILSNQWYALACIANDPYWDRMWIIQEVLLGSFYTMYLGGHQIPLHYLFDAFVVMSVFRIPALGGTGVGLDQLLRLREMGVGKKKLDLWTLIEASRFSEATESVDKIYALYGLTDDPSEGGIGLAVDYKISPDTLFKTVTKKWLQDCRTLLPLALATTAVEREFPNGSWALPISERESASPLFPVPDIDLNLDTPELRNFMSSNSNITFHDSDDRLLGIVGVIQREKVQTCGPILRLPKPVRAESFSQNGPLAPLVSNIFSDWISMALESHAGGRRALRMKELFHTLRPECSASEMPAAFERFQSWARVHQMRVTVGALRLHHIHWILYELVCAIILTIWVLLGRKDGRFENTTPPPNAINRRLCITDGGNLVLGPARAERGDLIVVARGWHVPLVLRGDERDGHEGVMGLIGDAWIPHLSQVFGMTTEQEREGENDEENDRYRIWLK